MKTEKERLIDAIEVLNTQKQELVESKEYKLGSKIIQTVYYLKHFKINFIISKMQNKHRIKTEQKNLYSHEPVKNEEGINLSDKSITNKKIVVYTCIIGKYDQVIEPLYYNDNVEYILFTNCNKLDTNKWKIVEIPEKIQKLESNILINRYIKMHPIELFNEYDYSIYIDGNVKSVSDLSSFINEINSETGLALHRHYVRDDIYTEAKACELYNKGDPQKIKNQIQRYEREKFPEKYGLLECNVIVTDLKNETAYKLLNFWWEEFLKSESYRDQLSLPYILWKNGYKIESIGNLGNNVFKNRKIQVLSHK